jgi:hypothetical protein
MQDEFGCTNVGQVKKKVPMWFRQFPRQFQISPGAHPSPLQSGSNLLITQSFERGSESGMFY